MATPYFSDIIITNALLLFSLLSSIINFGKWEKNINWDLKITKKEK